MTPAATKVARIQRVVDVVEAVLAEIVEEHTSPHTTAPVMVEFFTDLITTFGRMSFERLGAFLRQTHSPGD